MTKPRIIEAVREANGDATAVLIEHLKKGDMAREAERLTGKSGQRSQPRCDAGARRKHEVMTAAHFGLQYLEAMQTAAIGHDEVATVLIRQVRQDDAASNERLDPGSTARRRWRKRNHRR